MGRMTNTLLALGFAALTAYGGYRYAKQDCTTANYKVIETEQGDMLHAKKLDKSYQIQEVGEDIFVGDADHNFRGAKSLTIDETIEIILSDSTRKQNVD